MTYSWPIVIEKSIMLSGQLSLMMNSWKHTSMELWLCVVMTFSDVFTLVYLHILQTTQRSIDFLNVGSMTQKFDRILITSICNPGRCSCPHCLIPLDRVAKMGMHWDMTQHRTLTHIDNVKRRNCVETAHEKIYEQGYVANSRVVEDLLQGDSLIPTAVCAFSFLRWLISILMLC